MRYSRIAKNARLGDGFTHNSGRNARLSFQSTDLEWIKLKIRMMLDEGMTHGKLGTQKSGYGGTKTIYKISSRVHASITEAHQASIEDLIDDLDKHDLMMWYVDDGSWHKTQNLHHLYCNMLDDTQVELLACKIKEIYGIKPTIRKDRKKDGRSFNYLYFPRSLVLRFRPEIKDYLVNNNLETLYYKFGGLDYYDKLEELKNYSSSPNFHSVMSSFATGRKFDKNVSVTVKDDRFHINWIRKDGSNFHKEIPTAM